MRVKESSLWRGEESEAIGSHHLYFVSWRMITLERFTFSGRTLYIAVVIRSFRQVLLTFLLYASKTDTI